MTEYLSLVEVIAIHADQIERYGGSLGVRDGGLLEAALYRPQAGYYRDLIEEAASLWESLSQSHPFIDGNKRTAFAVAYTFLAINGAAVTNRGRFSDRVYRRPLRNGRFRFQPAGGMATGKRHRKMIVPAALAPLAFAGF